MRGSSIEINPRERPFQRRRRSTSGETEAAGSWELHTRKKKKESYHLYVCMWSPRLAFHFSRSRYASRPRDFLGIIRPAAGRRPEIPDAGTGGRGDAGWGRQGGTWWTRSCCSSSPPPTSGSTSSSPSTGSSAIKDGVGRPRPNFFWRCFPDGVPNYNNITGQIICHGDAAVVKEGHKSFPSGHTSWSFAGLGFLSWYLAGKIRAFDRGGHIAKLYIVILPLLLADYWHHWQDVFAGGILGLVVASFCYLQFFPSPSGEHGLC